MFFLDLINFTRWNATVHMYAKILTLFPITFRTRCTLYHISPRLFPLSDLPGFAGPCLPLINQKNPRQPAREARAKPSLSGMKEGSRVSLFVQGHSFRLFGALCDSWQLLPTEVSYTIRVRRSFAVKHVSRFLAGVPLVMFTTNATWL